MCQARGRHAVLGASHSRAPDRRPGRHVLTTELSGDRGVRDTYCHQMRPSHHYRALGIIEQGTMFPLCDSVLPNALSLWPTVTSCGIWITVRSVTGLRLFAKVSAPTCLPASPDSPTVCQ